MSELQKSPRFIREAHENPEHLRPHVTSYPETVLPYLSLRGANQIILAEVSDVQTGISFI